MCVHLLSEILGAELPEPPLVYATATEVLYTALFVVVLYHTSDGCR